MPKIALAALVLLTLLIAVYIGNKAMRPAKKNMSTFLIYPYLDLAEGGYRGNPYALSESEA